MIETNRKSERGQILIIQAFSLVALLGVSALALDASFLYDKRNKLQAAADAAAKTAGAELDRDPSVSLTTLENFAKRAVTLHGFTPVACGASGGTSTCVYNPPATGTFAGNPAYAEVVLTETTGLFFGRVLGRTSLVPGARAVAGTTNPSNCLTIMDTLSIGNTELSMSGCGVTVGNTVIGTNPNAEISGTPTPVVSAVNGCSGSCGGMGDLVSGGPFPEDPLKDLPDYTNPYVTCSAGVAPTLDQGCYSSIAESVTKLNAGEYVVTGDLNIGTNLDASAGVFIYLTGAGRLTAGNSTHALQIKALTSGTYKGIAIFQDRADSNAIDMKNKITLTLNGAIYMKAVDVDFKNGLDIVQTGCSLFIAKSLTIKNGNGSFSSQNCASTFGGAMFLSFGLAE